MINVVDLLSSYQTTIDINDNISYPYMFYQFVLFISTILGPATVIMMVGGAFNAVLGTNLWHSYFMAVSPAAFYLLVCFTVKTDLQVKVAAFMSATYAIVMMVVLVGTIINATMESYTSPNVVFFATLVGFYFMAAIFHPQEFFCVPPGALYFICLPSGYLLLIIYSMCNMHVVSWGTREVPKKKTKEELEKEKEEESKKKETQQKKKGIIQWLGIGSLMEDLKEYYRQMFGASRQTVKPENDTNALLRELIDLQKGKLQSGAAPVQQQQQQQQNRNELREILVRRAEGTPSSAGQAVQPQQPQPAPAPAQQQVAPAVRKIRRNDMENPAWLEDGVGCGRIKFLEDRERRFWHQLIGIHLKPLEKNKDKEAAIAAELLNMRTSVVFAYAMINVLWIVVVFQLQLLKLELEDKFYIPIPRADDPDYCERFEPLGLAFLAIFGIVLVIQFLAMMAHRWSTFLQIISITEIRMPWTKRRNPDEDVQEAIRLARKLQGVSELPEVDYDIPDADSDERSSADATQRNGEAGRDTTDDTTHRNNRRRARSPSERRRRRYQDRRDRPIGMRHIGGQTLSRNFKRRFEALTRMPEAEGRGERSRADKRRVYRTVRDRYNKYKQKYNENYERRPQERRRHRYENNQGRREDYRY